MKYKPCCSMRCMLGGCETQEGGGCYCVCRLVDAENDCLRRLSGEHFMVNDAVIYVPGKTPVPLEGEEKKEIEERLEKIRKQLETYKA